jgi:hypothetical protein
MKIVKTPERGETLYYLTHMYTQKNKLGLRNNGEGNGVVKMVKIQVYFDNYSSPIPLEHCFATREEAVAYLKKLSDRAIAEEESHCEKKVGGGFDCSDRFTNPVTKRANTAIWP